MYNSTGT